MDCILFVNNTRNEYVRFQTNVFDVYDLNTLPTLIERLDTWNFDLDQIIFSSDSLMTNQHGENWPSSFTLTYHVYYEDVPE